MCAAGPRNDNAPDFRSWGVEPGCRPGLAGLGFPDLKRANFGRLRPFRTILDIKFDFLAFVKAAVASALNRGEVREYISTATVRRNEAVTLIGVEPLNFALLSHFYSVLEKKNELQMNQGR